MKRTLFLVLLILSMCKLRRICIKPSIKLTKIIIYSYTGSQAPFWGEEVTSPAIVGLNTFLVRVCHPIEGLGGLLTKFFWRDG